MSKSLLGTVSGVSVDVNVINRGVSAAHSRASLSLIPAAGFLVSRRTSNALAAIYSHMHVHAPSGFFCK